MARTARPQPGTARMCSSKSRSRSRPRAPTRLIAEAGRAGVTLGVIFQDRLKPDVRRLKSLVDGGELGSVLLARAQVPWWRPPEYYGDSTWRGTKALDGGGALMNQAIHTVDLLQWVCGPALRVYGRTATLFHDIEVEDTAVAVIEFRSGALATLEAATCVNPGRPRRIEIAGSAGTAVLEGDRLRQGHADEGPVPDNASSPVVADVSAHRDVIIDFIDAIRGGRPPMLRRPGGAAQRRPRRGDLRVVASAGRRST